MLPIYFEMNPGETFTDDFGTDRLHTICLRAVKPCVEPLYQNGIWFDVFRDAQVDLLVDGQALTIWCAPYQLPVTFCGLTIEADLVPAAAGGIQAIPIQKAVRLAALSADRPWMAEAFSFPMPDGRWHASNYTHTWNGFVHVVEYRQPASVYYHRGEDFGAYPDRHPFVAGIDGVLTVCPPAGGDGDSNVLMVENREMGVCCYHANAHTVDAKLRAGDAVERDRPLALTGNTWAGHSVSDPHLHVGFYQAGADEVESAMNTYACMVRAYRERFPDELLPVAGGYRFVRAGESIELTARRSIACDDSGDVRYRWLFTDGTASEGEAVQKRYAAAGVYTEILEMTDDAGRTAFDTVMVYVSDGVCSMLPFATINIWPVRGIRAGQTAELLVYPSRMTQAEIDFGDGSRQALACGDRNDIRHAWEKPGHYAVTVRGRGEGCQGVFSIVVAVD